MAMVTLVPSAWADIAPSPSKGFRFIERQLVVDRTGVPDDIPLRYEAEPEGRRAYPTKLTDPLQPNVVSVSLQAGNTTMGAGGGWGTAVELEIPPPLEATHSADPRVRVERRYRVSMVEGEVRRLKVEVLEDVLYDKAGGVLCRRPPLGEQAIDFDPCDPTSTGRKRARYAKTAAMVGAPLLLLAGLFFVWRRRRVSQKTG